MNTVIVHGTAVALDGMGLIIIGATGSGKTDLALRLIENGAELIADDAVELHRSDDRLMAQLPNLFRGRAMIEGLGLIDLPCATDAVALSLAVACDPDNRRSSLGLAGPWHGLHLPQLTLNSFDASAPMRCRLALRRYGL